jgi:hypothetical protein
MSSSVLRAAGSGIGTSETSEGSTRPRAARGYSS